MPPHLDDQYTTASYTDDEVTEISAINMGPLPHLVGYLLRRAQLVVSGDFIRSFADVDIRPAQYSVLSIIEHNPGLRQSQVAEALGIKRTNFVALFDTLEERGLARRERVTGDRRALALHLTDAGVALLGLLHARAAEHDARATAMLNAEEKRHLLTLLERLTA